MLIALGLALGCFFLLHEVPATGHVTEELSVNPWPAPDVLVEVDLDVLPLITGERLPAAAANRPIIFTLAAVASTPGHSH